MTVMPVNEFDVVFISYDEPNADAHWQDLLEKCPWAKRSHGVWGSDAAHKAAARLSETPRFVTVDADNVVDPNFFNLELDMSSIGSNDVISWAAKNEINGLAYGNGGIKCWPKHVVEAMRTHEAAPEHDRRAQVDFCWNINYVQMNNVYSHVYNNGSPYQAYRAGFREGCKMTLNAGDVVDPTAIKQGHRKNYQRLLVWQTVGRDAVNGLWALYGARLGCVMTNLRRSEWDWRDVRDFNWHTQYWESNIAPVFKDSNGEICENTGYRWNLDQLEAATVELGDIIINQLGLEIAELDAQGSRFFKQVYVNPARVKPMAVETQVINELKLNV
jgi:hypothetical protein